MLISIQIARAIAILGVAIRHLEWIYNDINQDGEPWQGFFVGIGGHGVDLFFCVSGFIIAYILSKKEWTAADFYLRRIIRIYPFYWAFFFLYIASILLACSIGRRASCGAYEMNEYVASILLLPQKSFPLLGVAWSLEHEIIFYGIAGLACVIAGLRIKSLMGIILLLWAIGVVNHVLLPNAIWDYHLFSLYHIEFAAGMAVFIYQDRLSRFKPLPLLVSGFLGFGLTVVMAQNLPGPIENLEIDRGGASGLLMVVGLAFFSCCILVGLLNAERNGAFARGGRIWKAFIAALVLVGDASYALYLFHPTAYGVIGKAYGLIAVPSEFLVPALVAAVVVTTVASVIWLLLIERPLLAAAHKVLQSKIEAGRAPKARVS